MNLEPINYEQPKKTSKTTLVLVVVVVLSLVAGCTFGYFVGYSSLSDEVASLENEVSALQQQLADLDTSQGSTSTVNLGNVSLSDLYAQVEDSVVVIHGLVAQYDMFGRAYYSEIQGSGFVYEFASQMVVITNSHVVDDAVNITVTFNNGNSYPAAVLGSDPYAELAVVSADAPENEFKPLEIASSSNLQVGDPVLVVGTPYGLEGSMSTGVISALGRTLGADTTDDNVIANVIQTTAALNPGNSGGPVLNYQGQVIGIATAIVEDSEGLGFAIPSNTILKEINDLVNNGSYDDHPWLGAVGTDMTYEIAQELDTDVTYGWLISYITIGVPRRPRRIGGWNR